MNITFGSVVGAVVGFFAVPMITGGVAHIAPGTQKTKDIASLLVHGASAAGLYLYGDKVPEAFHSVAKGGMWGEVFATAGSGLALSSSPTVRMSGRVVTGKLSRSDFDHARSAVANLVRKVV